MFGYVKPDIKELLVKEHEFYKSTYCGICRSMKKHTGGLSPITITYDSVFLALVRMAYIPDPELSSSMRRCIAHPAKKKCMLNDNSAIEYTARAFAILSYYKSLIALRRGSKALRGGDFTALETGKQLFAYRRTLGSEQLTVLLNFSDKPVSCIYKGSLVRSNYSRRSFDGNLSPWEAVILK